jgi:threonine synthase
VAGAIERSGGRVVTVSDEAILDAWRALAQEEGVFCEPASAAGVAGLAQAGLAPGTRVVCVITGHGLKDPETAARLTPPPVAVDPDPDAIAALA